MSAKEPKAKIMKMRFSLDNSICGAFTGLLFFVGLSELSLAAQPAKRATEMLKQDDGRIVRLTTNDIPSLNSLRPVFLIVPAKKYLTNGEIFEQAAARAAAIGFYAARFDWSFSFDGLTREKEAELARRDLALVLRELKKRPYLDLSRFFVLAKSFGATLFAEHFGGEKVAGLFLLTPNCDEDNPFEKRFAHWFAKGIPVRATISVDDPYCDVTQMYRFQGKARKQLHTFQYFYGDHNFVGKTQEGIEAVTHSIVEWLGHVRSLL